MKIAYFDCSSGIAGNMIIGALIDSGLESDYLLKELRKLPIKGFRISITKVKRELIKASLFDVIVKEDHHHRNLKDILKIINGSKLNKNVKTLSCRIFKRLAEAEAKVHGVPINKVHFHEVGAVDAIIDIVGSAIGFDKLGIERIYCSPIPHGKGTIRHAHGILPIPAPAAAELLKGAPTYGVNVKGELTTPTGAAIITTLAFGYGDFPRINLEMSGNGSGTLKFKGLANVLRIFIGEAELPTKKDTILQIEANIDDLDPRLYDKVIADIMKAGALDAYITPIRMKKERTAINLVALCAPAKKENILEAIFTLTTTFGVRTYLVARDKLSRKFVTAKTKYGKAKVKLGFIGKELKTVAPEYEDYKRLAAKHHIPITKAYGEIKRCS